MPGQHQCPCVPPLPVSACLLARAMGSTHCQCANVPHESTHLVPCWHCVISGVFGVAPTARALQQRGEGTGARDALGQG